MTGYLSTPPNPLSIITVASLQDLGYTVNPAAANAYSLGAISSTGVVIDLHGREIVLRPVYGVDRGGVVRSIF